MDELHKLRENYQLGELLEDQIDKDPIFQFSTWIQDAIKTKQPEPNALVLSTINSKGFPSSRVLLLKEIDSDGFIFYTNYDSSKGQDIAINPNVALNFNWLSLQRQVRIEGRVEKIDEARSTKYFQSRPKGSQIGAWASSQSEIIQDRSVLEDKKAILEKEYENDEILPKPPHWGGYKVIPHTIEFWQGRRNRLHDRIRYILNEENKWEVIRLAP